MYLELVREVLSFEGHRNSRFILSGDCDALLWGDWSIDGCRTDLHFDTRGSPETAMLLVQIEFCFLCPLESKCGVRVETIGGIRYQSAQTFTLIGLVASDGRAARWHGCLSRKFAQLATIDVLQKEGVLNKRFSCANAN